MEMDEIEMEPLVDSSNCELNTFVVEHFKRRVCKKLVRNRNTGLCGCNHDDEWHHRKGCPEEDGNWDSEQHTEALPTNAYGELNLSGRYRAGKRPKYVRIDPGTKCEDLWTLLTKYWEVPKPKLILTINGGHKRMKLMTRKRLLALTKGLMNVAMCAETWLITTGFNVGVAKLVGGAVRDCLLANKPHAPIVVIAMATWGAVHNRQNLERPETVTKEPHVAYYYNSKTNPGKGLGELDPNQTHFILYDDGSQMNFNSEVKFRADFEKFVNNKMNNNTPEDSVAEDALLTQYCRTVQVVIEGNEEAIEAAHAALKVGTPVVFIQGSRGVADVVCELFEFSDSDKNTDQLDKKIDEQIQKHKEKWTLPDELIPIRAAMLKDMCTKYRKLVHSFGVDDSEQLDREILLAIFKSSESMALESKLALAMNMNQCDVAKQEIFSDQDMPQLEKAYLEECMLKALEQGLTEFVKLFLDHGIIIDDFLKVDKLQKLYRSAIDEQQSSREAELLRKLIKEYSERDDDKKSLMKRVGRLVQNFTGDKMSTNLYDHKEIIDPNEDASNKDEEDASKEVFTAFPPRCDVKEDENRPPRLRRMYTEQDLFLWAVFLKRMDLAKLFWRLGKDPIGSALVACAIFRHMQLRAEKDGELELSESLKKNIEDFEELAIGILAVAYEEDEGRSHLLLIRSLPYWGDETLLSLADQSKCMKFMSHTAVQTRLSRIWKGGMIHFSIMKTSISSLFCVPCIRRIFQYCQSDSENWALASSSAPTSRSAQQALTHTSQTYLDKFLAKQQAWKEVKWHKAIRRFYKAPVTKFLLNAIFYVALVIIFILFVLVDLKRSRYFSNNLNNSNNSNISCTGVQTASTCISPIEILVCCWMATFIIEEIRQVLTRDQRKVLYKIRDWISSMWNKFDLLLYGLFITGIVLRHTLPDSLFHWTMGVLTVVLVMLMLRFMQMYYVFRNLGPKVVMITKMVNDVVFFLAIFVVFVLAYGTAAQALLYSTTDVNIELNIKKIIFDPYWKVYGELSLQEVEGSNPKQPPNWLLLCLFAGYMLFTNVLLLNLLIAMLGFTFNKVQNSANEIWKYKRHGLIREYYDRPYLPPPFIILEIIYRLIRWSIAKCRGQCCEQATNKPTAFKVRLNLAENRTMSAFEQLCMERYMEGCIERCASKVRSAGTQT